MSGFLVDDDYVSQENLEDSFPNKNSFKRNEDFQ